MANLTVEIINSGLPILFLQFNGTFWMFLENDATSPAEFQAYSSPTGVVWTRIDQAGELTSIGWPDEPVVSFFDGAQTCTFWYQQGNRSGNVFLVQFNLATQTWGTPFAEQSPGDMGPQFIAERTDGSFVGVIQDNTVIHTGNLYKAQIWNGSSWGGLVDICAGIEALAGWDPTKTSLRFFTAALDSANVLHCIMATTSTDPTWNNRYFYQEITGALALQNFSEFPGQNLHPQSIALMNSQPAPNLVILGSTMYWGLIRNNGGVGNSTYTSVYVGAPLIGPTWTLRGNLDPNADGSQLPAAGATPAFFPNGASVYEIFSRSGDSGATENQAIVSTDGFNSNSSTTLTNSNNGGPAVEFMSSWVLFGSSIFLGVGTAVAEGVSHVYFATTTAGVPIIKITFRGVKRVPCKPETDQHVECPSLPDVEFAF